MSIKTLRKRIALVAVSALGVGLLSVAPASANIEAGELVPKTIASGGNTLLTACATDATGGVDTAVMPLSSPGLVLGTTSTVSANDDGYVVVTGPGVISAVGASWTAISQTIASTSALTASTSSLNDITIRATAVGTIKVTYSQGLGLGAQDTITITVVATCSNGTYSAANSKFIIATETTAETSTALANNIDEDAATVAAGGQGFIRMALSDVYGASLSSTKALIASVSGANCLVNHANNATSYSAGTSQSAVRADGGSDDTVIVTQADGDVPAKCTVSVTWDGINVGTKTFTFRGIPSKVTVSDVTVGRTGGNGFYRVSVEDSAGNPLPGIKISASSTEANNAAALQSGVITAVQANTTPAETTSTATSIGKTRAITASSLSATSGAAGVTYYTCGTAGGTAKLTVRALIDAGTATYATSAPFDVACGGALATWSISMDKATYAPGEIATLTLTGRDVSGRPVSTFTDLSGVAYAFGGMTAVTAPTNGDVFSSGIGTKTYQFSVGTSEGSFVGTFTTTGSVDTAAKTVQYKVANQTAAVSTNEVLAAIVKLIATINKQIRQLQKQLRR